MFERVGSEQKIGEIMKDDEELEMLLGEIPHATSLNLHQPQSNGGHGIGPSVERSINGRMCSSSIYGDDPSSHYKYKCASPVSGFSLQSDGSSSSYLSGDNGSPTPPPLEGLKSQMPCGNSHHPNVGLLHEFRVPDLIVGKMGNQNLIDELDLSRKFGRMCVSDDQKNFSVDMSGVGLFDHSMRASNQIGLERYEGSSNHRRGFSDYGGPQFSVPRSPMCYDEEMNSALPQLQCEYKLDDSKGLWYRSGGVDGLSDCPTYCNSSLCHRMMEQTSNYRQRGLPASNLTSSVAQPSVADASFCTWQNMMLNEEMNTLNLLKNTQTTHPWLHSGVKSAIQSSPQMLNGRTPPPMDRIPQRALEAFASEDGLIIPGQGIYFVMNKRCGRWGRDCKGSLHEINVESPQEKRSVSHVHPHFTGICENDQTTRHYCSAPLPPKCNSLAEARGYIYSMAKNQDGCRFLQSMFKENRPQDVQIIFNEIIDHVVELMINPFGNYLIQKLLKVCNEEQRMQILLMIIEEPGQLVRISLNSHGTRVVQKLIETLKTRQQISLVISALKPGFLALFNDLNGNHVVQRCLERFSNEDNKFIFVAAAKYCLDIGTRQQGCCVLLQCISHSTGEYQDNLVTEISANGLLLAQDEFGNYVVQRILELNIPSTTYDLISQFEGNFVHLSTQKFSSHVVEKCLEVFNGEMRAKVVHELLPHLEQLLQDPYANYVVQKALRVSEGSLHNLLVDIVESHKAISRNNPYSKKIFSQKLLKK